MKNILFSRCSACFVVISMLVSSCAVYHPHIVDIPLIDHKGDLRIDAGVSQLAQATVSYGLTDRFAVQGFGTISMEDGLYYQAALGYYERLGFNRVFETYIGFGHGRGKTNLGESLPPLNGIIVGNYSITFAQVNYGTLKGKSEYGVSFKTGWLHSNLLERDYYPPGGTGITTRYIDNSILFEPHLFFRTGKKNLKFSINAGTSGIVKITNKDKPFPQVPFQFGVGLNYRFLSKK